MYNHVRSRSSKPWACCRVSWTRQSGCAARSSTTGSLRLFSLLGPGHTLLLYAGNDTGPTDVERFERTAEAAVAAADGEVNVYLIAAPGADVATTVLPLIRDAASEFAGAYPTDERTAFVVRPDGYLGFADNDAALTA